MIYSHTQIAQYLRCPRSYRHRYLDGWREKDTRASMIFGRCFEKALLDLTGVVKTSRTTLNGRSFLNLEAFAPAGDWEELATSAIVSGEGRENGDGL